MTSAINATITMLNSFFICVVVSLSSQSIALPALTGSFPTPSNQFGGFSFWTHQPRFDTLSR